ncbi:hypothetical protein HPB51_015019 [Rhipicephalus microplus]|uniref:Uncharacterized protein n=1 Tax=Rhipicephalus microplus TaxID=6941 RepID=A0A9J6ET29_RHIMP|nr:hypothetical protein HPB51_015019 [Rhipicephalus microplus]
MSSLDHPYQRWPAELRVSCTQNGDVRCRLLEHRVAINTVLLRAGLEIMEDHKEAGGVRLAVNDSLVYSDPAWNTSVHWLENPALEYVQDLMADHCCFTAMEVYANAPCPPRVVQALRRSRTLKRLAIYFSDKKKCPADMIALVNSIPSLVELEFKNVYRSFILDKGPLMEEIPQQLKVLDTGRVRMTLEEARAFLWALMRNHTVTDLAVNESVFGAGRRDRGRLFALFVARRDAVLRKLTLFENDFCEDPALWTRLTKALSKATTLTELNVNVKIDLSIFAAVTAEFAQVVRRCKTLQSLQLPRAFVYRTSTIPQHRTMPWIFALWHNRSLSKLYISVFGMSEAQFRSLLSVIAKGENLTKVVIQDDHWNVNLGMLSRVIRELGMCDRLHIGRLHIMHIDFQELSKVPELSCVKLERLEVTLDAFRPVLEPLMEYANMFYRPGTPTEITIGCGLLTRRSAFENVLMLLAESSALTDVCIDFYDHSLEFLCGGCANVFDRVVSALATNPRITVMELPFFPLETTHLDTLCNSAREHRSLTVVQFRSCYREWKQPSADFQAAVTRLQDVVRQNASRMNAAVEYVRGEITADGARAVEELLDHPQLLERVRDEAGVTDARAEEMVKDAGKSVRNMDIHRFLWVTGVVSRRQASRHDPDAKEFHILDLPVDCWLHIRQFLKLKDVASG